MKWVRANHNHKPEPGEYWVAIVKDNKYFSVTRCKISDHTWKGETTRNCQLNKCAGRKVEWSKWEVVAYWDTPIDPVIPPEWNWEHMIITNAVVGSTAKFQDPGKVGDEPH